MSNQILKNSFKDDTQKQQEDCHLANLGVTFPESDRLTPEELKTYGGKFAHMTDAQAWEYIQGIESLSVITYDLYFKST